MDNTNTIICCNKDKNDWYRKAIDPMVDNLLGESLGEAWGGRG
jgi:hypothetical protein